MATTPPPPEGAPIMPVYVVLFPSGLGPSAIRPGASILCRPPRYADGLLSVFQCRRFDLMSGDRARPFADGANDGQQ